MHSNSSSSHFEGIWGSAPDNIYVVGDNGQILHYDGVEWKRMSTAWSGGGSDFYSIWGSSENDIYIKSYTKIYHYNGKDWPPVVSCTINGGSLINGGFIWGSSANDIFALGAAGTILHYDGNQWSSMESGTTKNLKAIWGTSKTNVYAVGEGGTIIHFNGNKWMTMNSGNYQYLFDIWGSSETDIYVAGSKGTILKCTVPPTLIILSSFSIEPFNSKLCLKWATAAETDTIGFNLHRCETENGSYVKINNAIISAKGSCTQGASYEFIDTNVKNRKTYYYKLEDIDVNGVSTFHGSESAMPRLLYGRGR
jgi:hypothetical protein